MVPLVEGNGCRKIKVAVLLQRAIPSLLFDVDDFLFTSGCMGGPSDAVPLLPLGGDVLGASGPLG